MKQQDFFQYLKKNIPMAEAMDIRLVSAPPGDVILSAPYEQNRNHHGSAFGGSIANLLLLAGWISIQSFLDEEIGKGLAVIARSEISYRSPIEGELFARVHPPGRDRLGLFRDRFEKKGKALIEIEVSAGDFHDIVESDHWIDRAAARFTGTFAGILRTSD